MSNLKKNAVYSCTVVFLICILVRCLEYFLIRTDETAFAENFIHKFFGILLLFVILKRQKIRWSDIGFRKDGISLSVLKGLLLGAVSFSFAYALECAVLYFLNHDVHLAFYASGFSLIGDRAIQSGSIAVLMCILFNVINVWMEEGVFRGLFTKILEDKPFQQSMLLIAFFFGLWHIIMPLRDYLDGASTIANFLVMGIGYIILAGIMSIKWSLLYRMTGSLWMGLGDHLFNNVIVTNLLHVVSSGEADSMQIVRIIIGQLLSCVIVLILSRSKPS